MNTPYTPIRYNEGPAKAVETLAAFLNYAVELSDRTGEGFDGTVVDHPDFDVYATLELLRDIHENYVLTPKARVVADTQGKHFLPFNLVDVEDGTDTVVSGSVTADARGVYLSFDNYQTIHDDVPVLIEQIGGVPRVVVWADNQEEDATHHVGLAAARVKFPVGSCVYWNDPEQAEPCSKWCRVVACKGEVYQLVGEDGSEVEAFGHELSTAEPE